MALPPTPADGRPNGLLARLRALGAELPGDVDLDPVGPSPPPAAPSPPGRSGPWRLAIRLRPPRLSRGWLVPPAVLVLAGVVAVGTGFDFRPMPRDFGTSTTGATASGELARLRTEERRLKKSLAALMPAGPYIVIDQTNNRLYLKRSGETALEATCSAGSGIVLKEGDHGRTWVFDTPRGVFKVRTRVEDPVWSKPDWAFVEEGKPVPSKAGERIEYGVLGEYGLAFGDGYLIHGTLYERLLGRSVSHGCIRLGKEDLRKVWAETRVGTPIYIF